MANPNVHTNCLYRTAALAAVLALGTLACGDRATVQINHRSAHDLQRLAYFNASVVPLASELIQPGDLVTRLGTDITSRMLATFNNRDGSFSHCGIASIEGDSIVIYHALGGEFNPDQQLLRQALADFANPAENKRIGVFRPALTADETDRLLQAVHSAYRAGLPFDMQFDFDSDDRQYCAEFVAKCFGYAWGDSAWMPFSQRGSFRYVAVDDLFTHPRMRELGRYEY